MNEIFDIKRFGVLLQEDARGYLSKFKEVILVCTVSYLGICMLYWLFSYLGEGKSLSNSGSFTIMAIVFAIGIMRAPYILYGDTNHKKKGINYAMLPVSSLEKFLSMFLMTAIVTPIVLLSSLFIVDSILALLTMKTYVFPYVLDHRSSLMILSASILFIPSTFLLGNVVFSKSKISKTSLSVMLFWVVSITLFSLAIWLYGVIQGGEIVGYNSYLEVPYFVRLLWKIVGYSIPAVLLFFTYRKIKTQQY